MDTHTQARTAYGGPSPATRTPRAIEYEAFARVTHRISAAAARGRTGFPDLAAALHDNRRLWTLLAGMVADSNNGLPEALRAGLFNLAAFTQRHTTQVLNGTARAEVLVDINTAVMRGLAPQQATAAAASPTVPRGVPPAAAQRAATAARPTGGAR